MKEILHVFVTSYSYTFGLMVLCMYVLQTKKSLVIGLVSKLNADGGYDTNIIIYVKL